MNQIYLGKNAQLSLCLIFPKCVGDLIPYDGSALTRA